MKKIFRIALIMMLMLALVSCGNAKEVNVVENAANAENNVEEVVVVEETEVDEIVAHYPLTFVDGMNREVTIEKEPMTVISLAPSMTEVVYALGLGDRLVARTDYCNYPPEAMEVESIGPLSDPNLEAIIALNPDLILMSTHASEEVLSKLDEAGLTSAILIAQESFDGVYEIINQAGQIFNVEENATAIVDTMKADVEAVKEAVKDVEKQTVYYVVAFGDYGDYTATGDTFIHDMLEMAGGTNVASDGEGWSYNLESVIEKDPTFVICSELWDTKSTLEQTDGYMDLTAVKEGRLVEINQDLLSRQGPRLAEGLKAIVNLLHPDLMK